jgi:Holliday junction DNA helicase RuvB
MSTEDPFAPTMQPLVAPELVAMEAPMENALRPSSLQEFIGQPQLKTNLDVLIRAAKARGEPMDHVLLYGNPGLGKTTLAHILAAESGSELRITSGPAISKVGDLAAILTNLKAGSILFVDEIHRMQRTVEEVLYPAMEDFALDLVVGKGPSARTVRLALEKFTLVGATTRLSLLSSPLRDRFGATFHLEFYTEEDIVAIVERAARMLGATIEPAAARAIARRARRTPRIANRLLKRVRDYAQVHHGGQMTEQAAEQALDALAIDSRGLDTVDRLLLTTMIHHFGGGPVGVETLAAATGEEAATIEEVHEPFLIQIGFLQRTPRGRLATKHAFEYLGIQTPPAFL